MKTLIRTLLAGVALTGLAGCASYDYGYAYGQPTTYGYYGYDSRPYYDYNGPYYGYNAPYYGYNGPNYGYANGPSYYDYPGYYYGAPAVGFSLGYSNRDHGSYDHRWNGRYDRNDDGGRGRNDQGAARTNSRAASNLDSRTGNPNSLIEAHPAPLGTNQQ